MGRVPMMEIFGRGVQLRRGQAHVRRWIDQLMPIVTDDSDPLGVQQFATYRLSLDDAPPRIPDLPRQGRRLHQGGTEAPRSASMAATSG
jgi:hypothetical protein